MFWKQEFFSHHHKNPKFSEVQTRFMTPSQKAFTASAFEIFISHSQFYFHITLSDSPAMTLAPFLVWPSHKLRHLFSSFTSQRPRFNSCLASVSSTCDVQGMKGHQYRFLPKHFNSPLSIIILQVLDKHPPSVTGTRNPFVT